MADILHQFIIKSDPQRVFDAFCLPKHLDNWWPRNSSGTPKMGAEYKLFFDPAHDWKAEVIHCMPGQEFTWKMTKAMDDWMNTTVGIKLSPHNQGTNIYFFHRGWEGPTDHYAISNFCWAILLNGLKNYVEKGEVVPFENRN